VNTVFASMTITSAGLCLNGAGASAPPTPGAPERTYVNDVAQDEDLECVRRIGSGDQRAYREMVGRYLAPITRFAQRVLGDASEAEEVAQETFLRLWTQAASFTPKAKAKTWLYRIARNQCIDRLRKRRDAHAELDDVRSDDRPSQLLARKETAEQVGSALQALPERQRAAITLVHYEGLDGAEACEILEVSTEALESLLARGRRTLRERLKHLATATSDSGEGP
jgi:RNA polymerase sigma-70 factor, ECF subfamily